MDEGKELRPMLTVAETAAELGITVRGVQDRLNRGLMAGERVSPRLWLISREEVERWKARGKLKAGRKPKRAAGGSLKA
jgi:excisionase family DNA binding protein